MHASMFVARWDDLPLPEEVVRARLGAPAQGRLDEARGTEAPEGFAHHGVGGAELSTELARMLECPAIEEAASLTLVPFAMTADVHQHREGDAVHVLISADRLRARWPARHDEAYRTAVEGARRAVQRGATSAMEHVLWLEHFLVEQLLPAAAARGLPVVVAWQDAPAEALASRLGPMLDGALSDWDG